MLTRVQQGLGCFEDVSQSPASTAAAQVPRGRDAREVEARYDLERERPAAEDHQQRRVPGAPMDRRARRGGSSERVCCGLKSVYECALLLNECCRVCTVQWFVKRASEYEPSRERGSQLWRDRGQRQVPRAGDRDLDLHARGPPVALQQQGGRRAPAWPGRGGGWDGEVCHADSWNPAVSTPLAAR